MSAVTLGAPYWNDVASVAIYKPDGTVLLTPSGFGTGGNGTASQVLPVTGDYVVLLNPYYANTGNVTITLSEDLAPAISSGGPAVSLNHRIGQNGRLTFSGTSGQVLTVAMSGNTIGSTTVALLQPDGATLATSTSSSSAFNLAQTTLPSSGTYSVNIDPVGINAGSITLMLYDPAASTATLQADYRFQNTRSSSVGSPAALADLGTNNFISATVDGTSTTVLNFTQNNGLSLSPTTGVVTSNAYSIVVLFSFAQTSSWRRLADFKNATSDNGLYVQNGKLNFYPSASGSAASNCR